MPAQQTDHRFFEHGHIPVNIFPPRSQVEDGVGDELAWPMVGDFAAALDVDEPQTSILERSKRHSQITSIRSASAGKDRLMFSEQKMVFARPFLPKCVQATLQRQCLVVACAAEPNNLHVLSRLLKQAFGDCCECVERIDDVIAWVNVERLELFFAHRERILESTE